MLNDRGPEQLREQKEANRLVMAEFRQRLDDRLPKIQPHAWWRFWSSHPRPVAGSHGIVSGGRRLGL